MQIYWTKIKEIIDENSDVKTFLLDLPQGFTWEEGAFTHLGLRGFNDETKPNRSLVRHMSISTVPTENTIGITTRIKQLRSEYKNFLEGHQIGDEVALFKTHSNVPLIREDKNIYLLSAGVGLATFRPLVLQYLERSDKIKKLHSLNIDTSKEFLFPDIFTTTIDKNFTSQFVDNRNTYYDSLNKLAEDQDGIFYIVGSDEFLKENITQLQNHGINQTQILLDKRENQLADFFNELTPTK